MNTEMNIIPRPEFPRPDFVRNEWNSLNGTWQFSFDEPVFDRTIVVPFCYQSSMSTIEETEDHDVVWYRREFKVEGEKLTGRCLLMKFGAVDSEASVWINDVYAGGHVGGNTSFEIDITEFVKEGTNEVTVRALDCTNSDKPRGKQTWIGEKFGCWYTPTTGIWQSVWLEYVGKRYLKSIKVTPQLKDMTALCEVFISGDEDVEAEITAFLHNEKTIICKQSILCRHGYGKISLAFPDYDIRRNEIIWSPEEPNLITLNVNVISKSGCADEVETYFGMRSIECENGYISLNGSPYYQRLVLDQGYWPESILTPPSDDAIQKDIRLIKEMGFNGARKHQKIEDPRYYYWADKMGLLVWGELPSAFEFNDNAITSSSRELIEFVKRDYNHPCIVTWVPVNESWGVRCIKKNLQQQNYCRMLTYLLKAMDPIRLVSSNDGWEQISETDICALHDYALFPDTQNKYDDMEKILSTFCESRYLFADGNCYQGQPVILTEYGGIAFKDEGGEGAWGYYGRVKDEEEFCKRLKPITEFIIQSGHFNGFCYTQLTDVMQEVNGLLTEDRKPKVSIKCLYDIFAKRIY